MAEITIIVDNTTTNTLLRAEHGFSCVLSVQGNRILFDTGQSQLFYDNLRALNLDSEPFDGLVLSHGHYDHTGGLCECMRDGFVPADTVYAHRNIFDRHIRSGKDGFYDFIGFDADQQELEQMVRLVLNTAPSRIFPGVHLSGSIPRPFPKEPDARLFVQEQVTVHRDAMLDEQFIAVHTLDGMVIVTGCCHAGVPNTLEAAHTLFPNKKIHALVGGLHLSQSSEDEINDAIYALKAHEVQKIVPLHCTGLHVAARLHTELPGRVIFAGAGSTISF